MNTKFIAENIENLKKQIDKTGCDVKIVAVSKNHPLELVLAAAECGIQDFGESRVQEAIPKMQEANLKKDSLSWHFVGHLQSNKILKVTGKFKLIQSVDSLNLAEKISKASIDNNIIQEILIQIKVSDEEKKFGVIPEEAYEFFKKINKLPNIKIRGVMAMAPYFEDEKNAVPFFRKARKIFDLLKKESYDIDTLSMGMSHDFRAAISEGSTMIRIGTYIFGERNYNER